MSVSGECHERLNTVKAHAVGNYTVHTSGLGLEYYCCILYFAFCRLTPAYGFMILIMSCMLYYIGDGPNWPYNKEYPTTVDPNCPKYWYLSLLYVNNIFHPNEEVREITLHASQRRVSTQHRICFSMHSL